MGNISLTPIIVAIVGMLGVIFAQPLNQLVGDYRTKRKRGLLDLEELKKVISDCTETYLTDFVSREIEELAFFLLTGIKTNWKSIPIYIDLKNQLGNNFTWEVIREAKPYLKFHQTSLYVSMNRIERFFRDFTVIVGFLIISANVFLSIVLSQSGLRTPYEIVLILIISIFSLLPGFLFITQAIPAIAASNIERRLNEVRNANNDAAH